MKRAYGLLLPIALVLSFAPARGAEPVPQAQDIINAIKPGKTRTLFLKKADEAPAAEPAEAGPATAPAVSQTTAEPPPQASRQRAMSQIPAAPPPDVQQVSVSEPQKAVPQEPPPSISLAITFAINSSKLTPVGKRITDQLGQALQSEEIRPFRVAIEGHTDASGDPGHNLKLSQERAEEVRQYLIVMYQVAPERLNALGKGSSEPINSKQPRAPENRRVKVYLTD
jgi:outer membrane protein OmpA-like peptidoglycan-associated protein